MRAGQHRAARHARLTTMSTRPTSMPYFVRNEAASCALSPSHLVDSGGCQRRTCRQPSRVAAGVSNRHVKRSQPRDHTSSFDV